MSGGQTRQEDHAQVETYRHVIRRSVLLNLITVNIVIVVICIICIVFFHHLSSVKHHCVTVTKLAAVYSELNYVQHLYFGFFIFLKLIELCRFVTYLLNELRDNALC